MCAPRKFRRRSTGHVCDRQRERHNASAAQQQPKRKTWQTHFNQNKKKHHFGKPSTRVIFHIYIGMRLLQKKKH